MTDALITSLVNLATLVLIPLLLLLANRALAELKRRGYHTTYVEALVRAVGAAENAASAQGKVLTSPEGREIGVKAALAYLSATVPDTQKALGINDAGAEQLVLAQMAVAGHLTPALDAASSGSGD